MSDSHAHLWPGVPLALTSAVLFGAAAPFAKLLLGSVDPQMLAGLLYLGAGVGLAAIHGSRTALRIEAPEAPLRRADGLWLAALVLFGGIAGPLLLMLGLARTSAASGSLLLNLEGLATMAIAWLVFRENVDRRLLLGAAAILAGAVALSWQGQGVRLDAGGLFIAAACLAWGIDNNLTRKLSSADPVLIALIKGLAAGSVNLVLALMRGMSLPPLGTIGSAAMVGFLGVGVSLVLFVLALRHLGTARTGAYFSLAPFVGAVVSLLLLHEPLGPRSLIAAAFMGVGVWLHVTEKHQHTHRHGPIGHPHRHHDEHHQHEHAPGDDPAEPHTHEPLTHEHGHFPDLHHRHEH